MGSRTGGRKGKALLGAAIALSTVPIASEQAEAYPEEYRCFAGQPKHGWTFENSPHWNWSLRSQAQAGIEGWNHIKGAGGQIHALTHGGAPSNDLRWSVLPFGVYARIGFDGEACDGTTFFNTDFLPQFNSVPNFMSSVAAHEMGHHLNLGHTGWHDTSEDNNQHHAIMSTRLGSVGASASRSFAKDDYGQATHRVEYDLGSYRVSTPNFGFENTSDLWGFGAGSASFPSAGSYTGSRHLKWSPSSVNSEVWQTTNITPCENNTSMTLVATGKFKKINAANVKHVAITLRTRNVDYGGSSPGGSNPTWDCSGMNQNNEARGPIIQRCQSMATPSTTWSQFSTADPPTGEPWWCPFVFNQTSAADGVDAIVVAQSAVQTPEGVLQPVAIDELTVAVVS